MARVPDLERFCAEHKLKMCSVAQIIEHRLARESLVRRAGPPRTLHTADGTFDALLFESLVDPLPHLVLTKGLDLSSRGPIASPTLVRMHRRHLLGDVFGDLASSPSGPTGDVLRASLRMIEREGRGALVYLRTQGGLGGNADGDALESELQTLRVDHRPGDDNPQLTHARSAAANALPAALRQIGIGGQILRDLGLSRIRLITANPKPLHGLDAFGLDIAEVVHPANGG